MALYIPRNPRESTGQKLSAGIGRGLEKGQQMMDASKLEEEKSRRNETLKQLTGVDMSGLTEQQQTALLSEVYKGKNKITANEEKIKSINKLLNDSGGQDQGMQPNQEMQQLPEEAPNWNQMAEEAVNAGMGEEPIRKKTMPQRGQQNAPQPGKRPLPHTPEKISAVSLVDKDYAKILQKQNDAVESQNRHEKDFEAKEKKVVGESFQGENGKYITKTYDQYEDSLRREAILDRMNELEESGQTSSSGIINLLSQLGLNEEWLKNPANEEYQKLAFDLLGGGALQADYGSRVLASEFGISMKRIPTLMQTPEGRRQIAENMKTMLLPSRLKQERLQYYIDKSEKTGEPLPHDLRGRILKDIKPQLEEAYDVFKERNGRYKVKEGTPLNDDAIEKYYYLSNGDKNKALKMIKEDGYDVE